MSKFLKIKPRKIPKTIDDIERQNIMFPRIKVLIRFNLVILTFLSGTKAFELDMFIV